MTQAQREAAINERLRQADRDAHREDAATSRAHDRARSDRLQREYQTAQHQRQQRSKADDTYYAAVLRRQWERRSSMEHYQRKVQRAKADSADPAAGTTASEPSGRPVFSQWGGHNTRPPVDSHLLKTFNITPDVSR